MNNLPRVATQYWNGWESNSQSRNHDSNALITAPPSHPRSTSSYSHRITTNINAFKYTKTSILPPLRRFSSSSSSSRSCAAADKLAGAAVEDGCAGTDSDNRLNVLSTLFGRNGLHSLMIFCRPSTPMRLSSASNRACDASRIYSNDMKQT